jgi:5-methylcytosine-specific restriction endonuclease McrA
MPIKPENKNRYPKDWAQIRERIQLRANDKCEWCGVVNYSWINRKTRELCLSDEHDAVKIICTTAHLDHTPKNCEDSNLAFLCQRCHNRYDMPHRKQTIRDSHNVGQIKLQL